MSFNVLHNIKEGTVEAKIIKASGQTIDLGMIAKMKFNQNFKDRFVNFLK